MHVNQIFVLVNDKINTDYNFTVPVNTCGSPPEVHNANETTPPGPFAVGHTHNYSACADGYSPFWDPYTTCQDDGRWTDVVFKCICMTGTILIKKILRRGLSTECPEQTCDPMFIRVFMKVNFL
jgi:hypothetical protein